MKEYKAVMEEDIEAYTKDYLVSPLKQIMTNEFSKTSLSELAFSPENSKKLKFSFSIDIPAMGAVSQKNSGRCWIYAGLNFFREKAAKKKNIDNFEFSQSYIAFWDKIEKANFFFNQVISTAKLPYDDRNVFTLFNYAIVDGGFWGILADLIRKYGLVPKEAMPETFQSSNTEIPNNRLNYYVRKVGADIRNAFSQGKNMEELYNMKDKAMNIIFSYLCQCYMLPPKIFDFEYTTKDGKLVQEKGYTPLTFRDEMIGNMIDEYIDVLSLPYDDIPFGKPSTINQSFNVAGGTGIKYFNLEFDKFKELIIRQLADGEPVICACDSDKMCNEELQIWDDNSFNYEAITGFSFDMTRKDYLQLKAGTIEHSMMLTGVNITHDGSANRWKLENSNEIDGPNGGYYTCSGTWFDKYMFSAVINKKYLEEYLKEYEGTPFGFDLWEII